VRDAVAAGRLPPADTWPQPADPTSGGPQAPTAAVEWNAAARASYRWGTDTFWDAPVFSILRRDPFLQWSGHVEDQSRWGFLLHADFLDENAGWKASNLVLPRNDNAFPLESHFITRGWLWYDFSPLGVEVGRDQVHWGPLDHSLLISDAIPFVDMIRGSLRAGPWNLEWILSTPETRTTGGDQPITGTSLMNLHRIEFATDTWRLAASELYIVNRGPTGPYVLADVFPVMVEHQADITPNNNCLVFDGEWVPAPGWRLMGQAGLDEVDAQLFGMPDDPVPTIWAAQAGVEWQGSWGRRSSLVLHTEGGYTHYLWGNYYDAESGDARAVYNLVLVGRTETIPLSSPYGPGTAWVHSRAAWTLGPVVLSGQVELLFQHEDYDLYIPYTVTPGLEGWGRVFSTRASVGVDLDCGGGWSLQVKPTLTRHLDAVNYEVAATVGARR